MRHFCSQFKFNNSQKEEKISKARRACIAENVYSILVTMATEHGTQTLNIAQTILDGISYK